MRWIFAFVLLSSIPLPRSGVGQERVEPVVSTTGTVQLTAMPARATIVITLAGEGSDSRSARAALDSLQRLTDSTLRSRSLSAIPWGLGLGENQRVRRMLGSTPDLRTSRDMIMRAGLLVEVPDASRAPEVLQALIEAGIEGPLSAFYSVADDDPRLAHAITRATAFARRDAEALAAAAGGRLGRLRQISRTPEYGGQSLLSRIAFGDPTGVPVPPGDIIVLVRVHATWEFLPMEP